MSFSDTRGRVEKIDEYFTHVRVKTAIGLLLFNHKGLNAAPTELRKEGTEVLVYQGQDKSLHVKVAPARKVIPQRTAAPQASPSVAPADSESGSAVGPAVAASPKIPLRRR